jgi:type II secretory pathway component PulK
MKRPSQDTKRGMILLLVLACLAIAGVLFAIGVRVAFSAHHVARMSQWNLQAQWLAESGLERAVAQLAADADYSGETWNIPAQDLGGADAGTVKIEVKPAPAGGKGRLVKVDAAIPDDPVDRVQYSRELLLEME